MNVMLAELTCMECLKGSWFILIKCMDLELALPRGGKALKANDTALYGLSRAYVRFIYGLSTYLLPVLLPFCQAVVRH